jgi:broad specificity phosphatase PhoE
MALIASPAALIVVRHASVDPRYHGRCYGRSDVLLGPDGELASCAVVDELTKYGEALVVHSGLQRTRFLADRLAAKFHCSAIGCEALQERDFGTWEMQPWNEIQAQHGDEMLRMISEPDSYRPGGGETTFEMRDRVIRGFQSLPDANLTIVVTHGGPIAALLGSQRQCPVSDWVKLIPGCGQIVPIHSLMAQHR